MDNSKQSQKQSGVTPILTSYSNAQPGKVQPQTSGQSNVSGKVKQ